MGLLSRIQHLCFVTWRIKKFQWLSNCENVIGKPNLYHPLLISGKGKISFGNNVQIGVIASPKFYSDYSYLEARNKESEIIIGNNVAINNSFSAIACSKISIGNSVLIGVNCSIIDSDGHGLAVENRNENSISKPVYIHNNVFIGSNVTILKGVTIGENAVIGNASVVTKDVPANVLVAGNPARLIRNL
jgi:acetyltransferase-like isoleucine patch superfamily enzyme